jgi:hypothetical protein
VVEGLIVSVAHATINTTKGKDRSPSDEKTSLVGGEATNPLSPLRDVTMTSPSPNYGWSLNRYTWLTSNELNTIGLGLLELEAFVENN